MTPSGSPFIRYGLTTRLNVPPNAVIPLPFLPNGGG